MSEIKIQEGSFGSASFCGAACSVSSIGNVMTFPTVRKGFGLQGLCPGTRDRRRGNFVIENKTEMIQIRVTQKEKSAIIRRAKRQKMSVSAYILRVLRYHRDEDFISQEAVRGVFSHGNDEDLADPG